MPSASLTNHDLFILEKIKDPESGPSQPVLIDPSLPRDPHITDPSTYAHITTLERSIISSIQDVELQLAGLKSNLEPEVEDPLKRYRDCVERLGELVEMWPMYASARNNRAQALRRLYGDGCLVKVKGGGGGGDEAVPLDAEASEQDLMNAGRTILEDLSTAIRLLMPATPYAAISSQASKTLSQAYTQRGALYHLTAKSLSLATQNHPPELRIDPTRPEAKWEVVEFEEMASRDFVMGGRYGNEVAGKLAVGVNPMARLCGSMVGEVKI
ncbi:hypothetical protein NA56DRAFT_694442 [Hyaloscypha hepaticicola]|uniref:Uncharacterized protein n=1 Tax=Hyaloscypha hepaticicola TaxID=2082293 RepID=A0A2J6PIP7_9HELO|nr:hypothetical protein NA56DRAFT_694442 [Hyaloscypha hepaticicola]